ncbi:MAG: DNA methyltransferase [Bdellovibrionota bacterium]
MHELPICQGIQVSAHVLAIFSQGVSISLVFPSFKWSNLASNNAGVTVSIVGLSKKQATKDFRNGRRRGSHG